jgi:hypothetical protein
MHFLDRIKWLLISRMRECGIPDYKKTKFNKFFQIRNKNQPLQLLALSWEAQKYQLSSDLSLEDLEPRHDYGWIGPNVACLQFADAVLLVLSVEGHVAALMKPAISFSIWKTPQG